MGFAAAVGCPAGAVISWVGVVPYCLKAAWRLRGDFVEMIYAFADFTLDTRRCELRQRGEPRHLEPQVYAVLCHLLEHRDRVVGKDELLDHIWGHRFVTPGTLNSRIKALRQALGDDGSAQRVIRTVRSRGFRFVADVALPAYPEPAGGPAGPAVGTLAPGDAPGHAEPTGADRPRQPGLRQQIRFCVAPDDVRLAYATSGDGPPLVKTANWLTHLEYDWDSPVWRHWLAALSDGRTLVRYDERGNGLSDWDVDDVSFDAWVRDLETVVDALGVQRFPLFGMSQGCAVAVAYAARHPQRVTRLVLYGGFAMGSLRRARTPEKRAEAEMLIRLMPQGWGRDNPAFRQFFATMFLPEGTPEQMRWFSDLQRVTTSPANAVRLRTTSAWIDVQEAAQRVRAPTLVLHATGDAAVSFEQGRRLAAFIRGARFVPLDSRNHILLESEPAWSRFVREVRAFLAADSANMAILADPLAR
jgi:pimeloyl-ACP methyl ester carboxylesterase/DNA-binding winged helix-turn-helix (wHTH) protein